MSAYVKTIISKAVRQSLAAAYEAINQEAERQKEDRRLRAEVKRSIKEREEATRGASLKLLSELNQKNLSKLAIFEFQNAPDPFPAEAWATVLKTQEEAEAEAMLLALSANKILGYFEEIQKINPKKAAEKRQFLAELTSSPTASRLAMIADSLKLTLSREITYFAHSKAYREELKSALKDLQGIPLAQDFSAKVASLIDEKIISAETMQEIRRSYRYYMDKAQEDQNVDFLSKTAALVQKHLSEQGYEIMGDKSLSVGGDVLFSDGHPDYRVYCSLDGQGTLSFQQLKVAASREEAERPLDDYELALEKEKAKSFCEAHDRVTKSLAEAGFNLTTNVIKEASAGRLPVLIDPQKAQKAQKKLQKASGAGGQREIFNKPN
ncbi:MAG: hypothetical protein LBE01_01750 [Deltaproteobacteria bacterium]|jgi:hypothetical protein|nr:hypothetical protein [Deltaproteobacteria bacterium]